MRVRAVFLLLVSIGAVVCGCSNAMDHSVAGRIRAKLPRLLGPAQNYDVKVRGASLGFDRSHIGQMQVHGDAVALAPGLTVDTLDATIDDVAMDTRSQKVSGIGPIHFVVGMSPERLNSYLAATAASSPSRPPHLAASISGQQLVIGFTVRPFLVDIPVSVSGSLAPHAGRPSQLDFVPTGGQVSIVPVPAGLVALALEHVNPVVDLSRLTLPISISRSWIDSGRVYLEGSAVVPASSLSA